MKIRTSKLLFLLPILLALAACGNKGPLLPPPAPEAEEWPESTPGDADTDDVDDTDADADAARSDRGVDPDARLDDGDDADDLQDAAAEDRVDGEGEDPVPGATVPATDGER